MILRSRDRTLPLPRRPLIMGILNLNADSVSGDGSVDIGWALERTRELVADGADFIDVGAESARTNRPAISEAEEIRRLAPFLEGFAQAAAAAHPADAEQLFPPLLSVNTWRPAVAAAALGIAGDLLNDMSGLPAPANAEICARHGAALLLMHTVGEPKIPHTHIEWPDILDAVESFFAEKIALAESAGMPRESLLLDPGLDFAKQRDDNLRILRDFHRLSAFGRPILLPISRKSVIGEVLNLPEPRDRDAGTVACAVAATRRGASILRVHNVRAVRQATRAVASLVAA
jgi:dihydropteroate synthase